MNGQELKSLRLRLGLTQTEMGKKIYVKRDAVAKFESGKRTMKFGTEAWALQLKSLADQDDYLASQGLQ